MKPSTVKFVGIALLAAALVTPVAQAAAGSANGQLSAVHSATAPSSQASLVPVTVAAYATVNASGTLVTAQSKNITASRATLTGNYQITTALASVAHCSYAVSSGLPGNTRIPAPIFAGATGLAGTVNGVFVQTYNSSHAATQEPFMLQIFC